MTNLPQLLSVAQAAELYSVSTKTIRRAIERGDLPAYRIGRAVRIKATDLDRIMKPVEVYRDIVDVEDIDE